MKIGVTGAAGFIGSRLCKRLREYYNVVGIDLRPMHGCSVGNVCDINSMVHLLEGCDVIVHLAGPVAEAVRVVPSRATSLQVEGTRVVAEAFEFTGASKLVVASSFYVYDGMPGDYGVVDETTPIPPHTLGLFGASKLMTEVIARSYAEHVGRKYVALRFGSAYGSGDCSNIVRSIVMAHLTGQSFEIWGLGQRRNQYTHVDDLVDGIIAAIEMGEGVYNLISPEPTSTFTMAMMVGDLTNGTVTFREDKSEAPSMPYMHSGRAQRELGWKPRPLREGLASVVREMQEYGSTGSTDDRPDGDAGSVPEAVAE